MLPTSVHSLPPFVLTSKDRLHALYSDISRQKRSNPTSYLANVNWWQRALESIVSSGAQYEPDVVQAHGRLVLHVGRSLMDTLKVEGVGKPLGLGAVIVRKTFHCINYLCTADCHLVLARMNSAPPKPSFLCLIFWIPRNQYTIPVGCPPG